jgi:hypothetical protein
MKTDPFQIKCDANSFFFRFDIHFVKSLICREQKTRLRFIGCYSPINSDPFLDISSMIQAFFSKHALKPTRTLEQ